MRVVDTEEIQWHTGPGHREPGVFLRDVLTGPEGGPGNYWLVVVRVEDKYDTPAHHHNFEQVRIMLEGRFNFGPQDQEPGTIGYFSEATTYEQHARGPSTMLLLQCEGGSGARYLSQAEMRSAVNALKAKGGDFSGGVYRGPDPITSALVEKDSVEALWEYAVGSRVRYPRPRYSGPIIMDPEAFEFQAVPGFAGVWQKTLGVFNERRLEIAEWKFEPGAEYCWKNDRGASQLLYVTSGNALLSGQALRGSFAAEIEPNDHATLAALDDGLQLYVINLPARRIATLSDSPQNAS